MKTSGRRDRAHEFLEDLVCGLQKARFAFTSSMACITGAWLSRSCVIHALAQACLDRYKACASASGSAENSAPASSGVHASFRGNASGAFTAEFEHFKSLSDDDAWKLASVAANMMGTRASSRECQSAGGLTLRFVAATRPVVRSDGSPTYIGHDAALAATARAVIAAALRFPRDAELQHALTGTLPALLELENSLRHCSSSPGLAVAFPPPAAASVIVGALPGGIPAIAAAVRRFPADAVLQLHAAQVLMRLRQLAPALLLPLQQDHGSEEDYWEAVIVPQILASSFVAGALASMQALFPPAQLQPVSSGSCGTTGAIVGVPGFTAGDSVVVQLRLLTKNCTGDARA